LQNTLALGQVSNEVNGKIYRSIGFKLLNSSTVGIWLGRSVPLLGWGILAYDVFTSEYGQAFGMGARDFHNIQQDAYKNNPMNIVCFEGGTKVWYDLKTTKPIETIEVGDSVLSYNFNTNSLERRQVTHKFTDETTSIYELRIESTLIRVTGDHPFYVMNKGWTKVKDLSKEDLIFCLRRKIQKIKTVRVIQKPIQIYNIEVDGNHNFFISQKQVLVHNT
jgi:hypothetical protein